MFVRLVTYTVKCCQRVVKGLLASRGLVIMEFQWLFYKCNIGAWRHKHVSRPTLPACMTKR